MALLNRFSKLNDRGETGIFTFIVTKSVTRDFHRDATTKDFCFGYHRWAISFQRPTEKVLGVHLLLRNPSPSTSCVVDFTLTLLNREHFSQNEVYSKRQAKFTITNPMQGVPRWIQMSDLTDRRFSNETGEFLFELSLSNMTTIFECDIQLSPTVLTQYKSLLKQGNSNASNNNNTGSGELNSSNGLNSSNRKQTRKSSGGSSNSTAMSSGELINLETNYFTFGAFDWSLTIVPLIINPSNRHQTAAAAANQHQAAAGDSGSSGASSSASSSSNNNNHLLLTPNNNNNSSSSYSIASNSSKQTDPEPVCRVYLNRLNGLDCLCRVKYRVILGHHNQSSTNLGNNQQQQQQHRHVDSKLLDQISDSGGRIRGHQFRSTNILKLISLRQPTSSGNNNNGQQQQQNHHHQQQQQHHQLNQQSQQQSSGSSSLDLRVHIEMFCANTVSEARVPIQLQRKPNEPQTSNCSDRNKQAWCVESDCESGDNLRLKLFFMDLQSVPRNHIRYISWIAYVVARDPRTGQTRESLPVKNSPHSNYYLQDGMDLGTIMETDIPVKELTISPSQTSNSIVSPGGHQSQSQSQSQVQCTTTNGRTYLEANQLTVHIEWVDSLLLFSHLYNNYDSLATIQRHQIRRELNALQQEYELLERKYIQSKRSLSQLLPANNNPSGNPAQTQQLIGPATGTSGDREWQNPSAGVGTVEQQQQQQVGANRRVPSPMSHAERLKFSSSTPPSRRTSNSAHQAVPARQQQHLAEQSSLDDRNHHHHHQSVKSSLSRRRLPQQPLATALREVSDKRVVAPPPEPRRDSQTSTFNPNQQMRSSLGSLELTSPAHLQLQDLGTLSPLSATIVTQHAQTIVPEHRRLSPSDLSAVGLTTIGPRRAHSTLGQLVPSEQAAHLPYLQHHQSNQIDQYHYRPGEPTALDERPKCHSRELYLAAGPDHSQLISRSQELADYGRAHQPSADELEVEMQSLYLAATGNSAPGELELEMDQHKQHILFCNQQYEPAAEKHQQLVIEHPPSGLDSGRRSPHPAVLNNNNEKDRFDYHHYERYEHL